MEAIQVQPYIKYLQHLDETKGWEVATKGVSGYWKPEPGERIKGIFVHRETKSDGNYDTIYILGTTGLWGISATKIIAEELRNLKKGELLDILYLGEFKNKSKPGNHKKYFILRKRDHLGHKPKQITGIETPEAQPETPETETKKEPGQQLFQMTQFESKELQFIASLVQTDGQQLTLENIKNKAMELDIEGRMAKGELPKILRELGNI